MDSSNIANYNITTQDRVIIFTPKYSQYNQTMIFVDAWNISQSIWTQTLLNGNIIPPSTKLILPLVPIKINSQQKDIKMASKPNNTKEESGFIDVEEFKSIIGIEEKALGDPKRCFIGGLIKADVANVHLMKKEINDHLLVSETMDHFAGNGEDMILWICRVEDFCMGNKKGLIFVPKRFMKQALEGLVAKPKL